MPCIACTVRPTEHGWIIDQQQTAIGPYHSDGIALRVAVANALDLRRKGGRARVTIKDATGCTRAEYCLCREFKGNS